MESALSGCEIHLRFVDWPGPQTSPAGVLRFDSWTNSTQSDSQVLGKISWTDRYHSRPAAGCWTGPSRPAWSAGGRVGMTGPTARYDPASAAAVSAHSRTEWRAGPRSGYLKHEILSDLDSWRRGLGPTMFP